MKKKYILDGRVLDGGGIYTLDTLEEAKGVWCFWRSIYEVEESLWNTIKTSHETYEEVSKHLKENFTPIFTNESEVNK